MSSISRAGGDAILQSACKLSLEGIVSKKLNAPYRSGRSENWTKAKCRAGHEVVLGRVEDHQRKIPLADGGRASRRPSRLCRHRRHRLRPGHGPTHHAGAEGGGIRQKSVRRQGCAEEDPRRALAEARACRRDRIRRLDRWRQHPAGGVQGAAPGQAGRRSGGGKAGHDRDRQACGRQGRLETKSGSSIKTPSRSAKANPPK